MRTKTNRYLSNTTFFPHALHFLLWVFTLPCFASPPEEAMVNQALFKYNVLEKYNASNERLGRESKNEYIILLEPDWHLSPDWIEEQGKTQKVLAGRYEALSKMLKDFNDLRKDDLRFYVVVVNDYQMLLNETIDISKLPARVTNLSQLVQLPDVNAQYDRCKKEIARIPAGIANAMLKAGYTNRVIYFFSLIRLFKLDKKERTYRYDNLTLLGDDLKSAESKLRESAKKTFTKTSNSGEFVQGAVTSLINAIHVVVDEADDSQPAVDCSNSTEDLVNKTKDLRTKHYATAVTETATLLDVKATAHQKGSKYLLVDEPAGFAAEDLFTTTILPDKLTLLANGNSDYKVYVVFKAIDFLMPGADWKTFALDVAAKSVTTKTPNTIVVVVPYYKLSCLAKTWIVTSQSTGLFMPGVFCADQSLQALMNAAMIGPGNTWEANFNQAFSYIPKKYYLFKYAVSYDFIVKRFEPVVSTGAGHKEICDLQILVDNRLRKNIEAKAAIKKQFDAKEQLPDVLKENYAILRTLPSEPGTAYLLKHGIKESALIKTRGSGSTLNSIAGEQFVKWFVAGQAAQAEGTAWASAANNLDASVDSPADAVFITGVNPVKLEKYYDALDNLGMALNFAELDWITDGAGFLVASYYQDTNSKVVYASSLAIPVGAIVIRTVVKRLKILKKTAQGWELVEDAVSVLENLKSRLHTKGWSDGLVSEFEKDFVGNAEMLAKFDQREGLLDAWEFTSTHVNIRRHVPSLEKVSDLLNDADFIGKLPNGRSDLDEIIDAVKNPLDGGTASKLAKLSDHLENVRQVVKKHAGVDGFDRLMTDLKNPSFAMQDGVTHMLGHVKNFPEGKIKKFDYEFDGNEVACVKCRFDVELSPGNTPKLIEYKSWSLENIPNLSIRQLTEYFRSANTITDIKYVFNKLKTSDISAIKSQMKNLLSDNLDDIFEAMPSSLRENLLGAGNDDRLDLFEDLVSDTGSKFYDFIEIK
ncbi:hypothetical protein [Chryseolinea soli]|uniref:Uncharacterized protein n=1 Tax=Chryseolinea soli TaxID=2321403 RepID=A0A385SG01_9BACT|nr:hypothetical protein [Chryseolinea soli]AYB29381.1 hypothetical protein D4L85_01725 [Chryseolinea soli]